MTKISLTKFVFSGCTALACNSNISKLGKTVPQLQVTWPWPTRGIFVGLPLELPRPEVLVVMLGILEEGNDEVGVLTGKLCCCPYIVLAAAIAAKAAGGKSP